MHRYLQPGVEEGQHPVLLFYRLILNYPPGTPAPDSLDQPLSIDHPDHSGDGSAEETSPFEKYDPLLHGGVGDMPTTSSGRVSRSATASVKKKEVLSIAFIKKYIQYAKARPAPVLTKGAADWIVNVYARLRNEDLEENGKRVGDELS